MPLRETTMTRTQLQKALTANNITAEIRGRGASLEVEIATSEDVEKFCANIADWGGFTTGYGAVILRAGYVADPHPFDSVCARAHY